MTVKASVVRPFAKFNRDSSRYGKRHVAGQMNKTEESYAGLLAIRQRLDPADSSFIFDWHFEAITLKLAADLRYTPDFMVLCGDLSIELVNTKGGGPVDPTSLAKMKMAADKFPCYRFVMEQLTKKDGWKRREF